MPHIHDKIDFTVSVFIVHKDKVLMRIHDKYNKWLSIGGHIELDEDPIQALHREIKEEAGLSNVKLVSRPTQIFPDDVDVSIIDLPVPAFLDKHTLKSGHVHIDLLYVAKSDTDELHPENSEENNVELRWMSLKDLNNPDNHVTPNIRYYATESLKIVQQHD